MQPLTRPGDREHPTGFFRDGYCWGSDEDPGQHYVGGVVTKEFLEFSKSRGKLRLARKAYTAMGRACAVGGVLDADCSE